MKKTKKKLDLNTQTVRDLTAEEAPEVAGGTDWYAGGYVLTRKPAPTPQNCTEHYSGCAVR